MSRPAQSQKAVHVSGVSVNTPVQLEATLAELSGLLLRWREKRDALPTGSPSRDAWQARIDHVQFGYDTLVKCFHGEHR